MKKVLAVLFVIALAGAVMAGCGNRTIFDTTYTFSRAIVFAPDGTKVAEGKVDTWCDYDDSDIVQVRINGRTYLTAAENVIMVAE